MNKRHDDKKPNLLAVVFLAIVAVAIVLALR